MGDFMKKIYENLVQIPYLSIYTKVLFSALELKLFDYLKEAKTSKEISDELKFHHQNTELFLNGLYSLGLLKKEDDKFQNMEETNRYLISSSPYFFGDFLRASTNINDPKDFDFVEMIKYGPNIGAIENDELSFEDMFQDMKDSQSAIRSTEIVEIVRKLKEYSSIKKILDLGCGAGLMGLSIVSSRDDISGVLFDKPEMGPLINQCVEEKNLGNRVEVKLGDFLEDDIGNGYDFVLSVGTFFFAKFMMATFLEKIYDSLNNGGVFMTIVDEISLDYSKPKEFVLSWLPYAMNGMDIYMTENLFKDEAKEVGFKDIEESEKLLAFGHLKVFILRK
ncbi:MAG: hypothetical protein E7Z75_00895 [Methanobrevibacter olleyae]|uniref:SAM-dependent methyltransferase n=1 Tax=Methanobrevibacter olleyae TaxID=294671 RepID=A0A8T3VUM1_METOL|nr:hypothetical protein [Methanobrevibacter olleyae]